MAEKTVKVQGRWKGKSAGGCVNNPSWRYNPQVFFTTKDAKTIRITLTFEVSEPKKKANIGFYVATADGSHRRVLILSKDNLVAKTSFAATKTVDLSLDAKAKEHYVVIPCTFKPGLDGMFQIEFTCVPTIKINPLVIRGEWKCVTSKGGWKGRTAGGCRNHPTCIDNPQFLVRTRKATNCTILLSQTEKEKFEPIGLYVLTTKVSSHKTTKFRIDNVIGKSDFGRGNESVLAVKLEPKSKYLILPSTFEPGHEASFVLSVFTDNDVKLRALKDAREVSEESEWDGNEAGGCIDYPTWRNNPQYFLAMEAKATVQIALEQLTREMDEIGFYVMKSEGQRVILIKPDDMIMKTGFKKEKIVSAEITLEKTEKPYIILPTTKEPGKNLRFRLTVSVTNVPNAEGKKSKASSVLDLLPCNFAWIKKTYKGRWVGEFRGGKEGNPKWLSNPQFTMNLATDSRVVILISQPRPELTMGVHVLKSLSGKPETVKQNGEVLASSKFVPKAIESVYEGELKAGTYNILCATDIADQDGVFELQVYCNSDDMALEPVGVDQSWVKTRQRKKQPVSADSSADWNDIKIVGKLGQGGFGVVYKGEWKGIGVAVKKLNCDEMGDHELDALQQEVSIMSKLDHPNVLKLLAWNMDGQAFMITELMPLGNLGDILTDPKVDYKMSLKMARDAAAGMQYLHAQKPTIVHRDLKSLNLLVDSQYNVKVADFGLSKATQENSLNTKVGSLNWCPPEILLKRAPYTKKSDVYSYGMVLYELACREPPFKGMNPLQVVRAIDENEMPELPADLDEDFRELVEDCWKTEPDDRPDFDDIVCRLDTMMGKS